MADLLSPEERAALQEPLASGKDDQRPVSPAVFPSAGQLDPERTAALVAALRRWLDPVALELSRQLRLPCVAQAPFVESHPASAASGEAEVEFWAMVEGCPGSDLRLSLPRSFVAAVCERIFGAPFELRGDRPLAPAEQRLVQDLVRRWCSLFEHAWPHQTIALCEAPDENETSEPPASRWLGFTSGLFCGPVEGSIHVAMAPLTTRVLLGEASSAGASSPERVTARAGDVPVELRAVLGQADFSLDELSSLRIGDVIALDRRAHDPVDIVAEDRPLFRARAGLAGQLVAIELISGPGEEG